jgi:hypothetical protein
MVEPGADEVFRPAIVLDDSFGQEVRAVAGLGNRQGMPVFGRDFEMIEIRCPAALAVRNFERDAVPNDLGGNGGRS